jgi:copper chaperone CopZ
VPLAIQELAKQTVQRINNVVKLNGMNWWSDHEQLNRYRRRRIPHYFINKNVDVRYPYYVCESKISEALSKVNIISVSIDLNPLGGIAASIGQNGFIQIKITTKILIDELISFTIAFVKVVLELSG